MHDGFGATLAKIRVLVPTHTLKLLHLRSCAKEKHRVDLSQTGHQRQSDVVDRQEQAQAEIAWKAPGERPQPGSPVQNGERATSRLMCCDAISQLESEAQGDVFV